MSEYLLWDGAIIQLLGRSFVPLVSNLWDLEEEIEDAVDGAVGGGLGRVGIVSNDDDVAYILSLLEELLYE